MQEARRALGLFLTAGAPHAAETRGFLQTCE